ncbi:MAG: AAA family ATPase, partial [Armatimonadetes bacterium]|nr:AAA family ATPase [Armatimonadota bacterium]
LVKAHDLLQQDVATVSERLHQQRLQLEESLAEIQRLAAVEAQLQSVRSELEELSALLDLLGILRNVLREAGPKITHALVQVISLQAAQLYSEIMADHTARLDWAEDYDILLTTKGRERTFQQLSGGEQMAAALSVRLALLKEVSTIDIAFFDEPTANLDEYRRENLAEQILTIASKGFSQLFIISHDDTFERNTDNVIRIVKEDGASRVEV